MCIRDSMSEPCWNQGLTYGFSWFSWNYLLKYIYWKNMDLGSHCGPWGIKRQLQRDSCSPFGAPWELDGISLGSPRDPQGSPRSPQGRQGVPKSSSRAPQDDDDDDDDDDDELSDNEWINNEWWWMNNEWTMIMIMSTATSLYPSPKVRKMIEKTKIPLNNRLL